MHITLSLIILFVTPWSLAQTAEVRATIGSPNTLTTMTHDPSLPDITLESGSSVVCAHVRQRIVCKEEAKPECKVIYNYVGKDYKVFMPNSKKFGTYKSKKKAVARAKELVLSKVCETLLIDFDYNETDKDS